MAEFHFSTFVYILFLIIATTDLVNSLQSYTEHHLERESICHPLGRKRGSFILSNEKNAAVIVKPTHMFSHWNVVTNVSCKFVFKAHKGEHLFAVIQNMSLRGNETHCLDYIKFKRKDKHETREFCGQIDRRKGSYRSRRNEKSDWEMDETIKEERYSTDQDYAEFDPDGEIETTIFISKTPLKQSQNLDLTIVYTPYKDCQKIKTDREEYRSPNFDICLWEDYFCDGYQNCVPEICRDEENCSTATDVVGNGTGTKVTIGAVTTMLLCFIIFVMGLWICRRHKKLCWSSDCAGPGGHDNRLGEAEREAAVGSAHPSVAVAPMLEVAVLPSVLDKDLPPSYDSLFPEQANPSTT